MTTVEKKIYEGYLKVVQAVVDKFKVKQYDEAMVQAICEQLAIVTERILRDQEEDTYCAAAFKIKDANEAAYKMAQLKQEMEAKIGNVRGTGIDCYEVKIMDDMSSMFDNGFDDIFLSEYNVRGIETGDVYMDDSITYSQLKDALYKTLTGEDNV